MDDQTEQRCDLRSRWSRKDIVMMCTAAQEMTAGMVHNHDLDEETNVHEIAETYREAYPNA
jgi:aminoglycoside phosphotransferase